MKTTVTIRDLRNRFPKVRNLVEAEGEVLLTGNIASGASPATLTTTLAPQYLPTACNT